MKESETKVVALNGTSPTRAVLRSVKRQVEKWIEKEQTLLKLPSDSAYTVQITSDPQQPIFDCEVHVQIGTRAWEGHEYAKTLQDAVNQSITHMRYVQAVA